MRLPGSTTTLKSLQVLFLKRNIYQKGEPKRTSRTQNQKEQRAKKPNQRGSTYHPKSRPGGKVRPGAVCGMSKGWEQYGSLFGIQ